MTQQSIDLTEVAASAFERKVSAQLRAYEYADMMLRYPHLLYAIVTAKDGQGNFAFTADAEMAHGQKRVDITAPNQERFVFTAERGGKVLSKTLRAGQGLDVVSYGPPKKADDIVRDLVDWCGERTPPAFISSLRANLASVQEREKQRQAGINAAVAEEPLAQHRAASRVGFGGTDGAGQPALGSA